MPKIRFREERCKGCRLCTTACPRKLIAMSERINEMGYHPAVMVDEGKCTGCTLCAIMCPDLVIEVLE